VDVHYRADSVVAAAVTFARWTDERPASERVVRSDSPPAAYVAGSFYRRELPYLIDLLRQLPLQEVIVIDGFVWLEAGKPGLGAHLFEALGHATAIVGVAKRPYRGLDGGIPVLRGTSRRPLYVTAVGMDAMEAAQRVAAMHGRDRIPTLIKRADQLSREA
jgi:deoxyribonuclease V